ncbi:MAG: polyamine aminopropyltransferase [Firmicutes bacterium]|nr:polyamine aminopropyltransferase [Bacillota bacterium]
MNTWFTELQTHNVSLGLKMEDVLWHEKTPYQELAVLETEAYGRMLVLDGAIQTTASDEFVYHEMIAHVPLLLHSKPRKVAVIGGGDGGAIREILRHPGIEEAHLIEIDEKVMEASKRFFPEIAVGLEDDRAHIHFTDGIAWVKQAKDFDVILVDSTDPVGPAEGLFVPEFYQSIHDALSDEGIMVAQSESPFLEPDIIRRVMDGVSRAFPVTRLYLSSGATYPSGLWSFTLGAKNTLPAPRQVPLKTRYWTPDIQKSCFHLPGFVEELIR